MTYTESVVTVLIGTLRRHLQLDGPHFASQAVNAEFWSSEVAHGRKLLADYDRRFERQKGALKSFQESHGDFSLQIYQSKSGLSGPPLKRGLKTSKIKELDREIVDTFRKFLQRGLEEGLIDHGEAKVIWELSCDDCAFDP